MFRVLSKGCVLGISLLGFQFSVFSFRFSVWGLGPCVSGLQSPVRSLQSSKGFHEKGGPRLGVRSPRLLSDLPKLPSWLRLLWS